MNDFVDDINIIVCESCRTENKIENFEIQDDNLNESTKIKKEKSDKKRRSSSSKKEFNRPIRLYVFRTIYEMLKDPEHNYDIKEDQGELTKFQLNRLANALRKKFLEQEIQEEWFGQLQVIKRLDFEGYYEDLQLKLSSKRQFREDFLRDFQKAIEFVFELIKGKQKISELKGSKKEIAEDLIKKFGFSEDVKKQGNFEIFLAVFISRYIYDTIKDPKFESVMGEYKGELTITQTDKLAFSLKKVISYQGINDIWLINFNRFKKRRFLKNYHRLQTYILTDQLYSITFLDYLKYLIRLVDGLINGKNNDSELKETELTIASDLGRGDPFQNLGEPNALFKLNLIIVLGRIVYLTAKAMESARESVESQTNSLEVDTDRILNLLMQEIITKNKINDEFLKKLYKIKKEDFEKSYEKLKSTMKSDQICCEQLSFYLKWIIETILNILSGVKSESKFSIYEKAIVRDLKNFQFNKKELIKKEQEMMKMACPMIKLKTSALNSNKIDVDNKDSLLINYKNFQDNVLKSIEYVLELIPILPDQKIIVKSKSIEILNKHISRIENDEITISSSANPLINAATIIYAVLESDNTLPKISGESLSRMVGASGPMIGIMYNKWYKDLISKANFEFKNAQLGESRKAISLYIFELVKDKEINTSDIVSQLKEIISNPHSQKFKIKEQKLIQALTEREIKTYKDMLNNYPETFNKYFSDLVNIIKLMIVSIKFHKIIKADFSAAHFGRFLMEKNINLFLTEAPLFKTILLIFNFLKESKYSNLFPIITKTETPGTSKETRIDIKRRDIVGSRIKLFVMENIYEGVYLDKSDGIIKCPNCLREGLKVNTFSPRKRAKEFHHSHDITNDDYMRYDSNALYDLFTKIRGNPYFLQEIINQMEKEKVILTCANHHNIIHTPYFIYFKKLINWEDIPNEFPYRDIFDLPADIIHSLIIICLDNFYKTKTIDKENRNAIKLRLISFLKKRYIIDRIYGGVCPCCGEFNTKDHLPVFEYNHLYELSELNSEEREKRKKIKIPKLFESLSCSEIVREMEKKYNNGGYTCRNCHFVIHGDVSNIDEIFDDEDVVKKVLYDKEITLEKFKQNLVHNGSIEDILKSEKVRYESVIEYLFALFEISRKKQSGVTRMDLGKYLGYKECRHIIERREFMKEYVKVIAGGKNREPLYFLTSEGNNIVRLMYYFQDYYRILR